MEYAAVFLLSVGIAYCAMRGLATGAMPSWWIAAVALAASMCVPSDDMHASFFVAAAIGAYALFSTRDVGAAIGAAACACVFALGGQAAMRYAAVCSFVLAVALAAAFAADGKDLVGRVVTGSVIADLYSVFAATSGFLRCTAAGPHTAYYLVFAGAAAIALNAAKRSLGRSGTLFGLEDISAAGRQYPVSPRRAWVRL